ncbi:DOPA 4,5-dioxygenase family protein [Polaromonas sp.]|uniref:DOPA 4,5-dioxygenase family protein n=1 Tax=Polaromonas sp. TaxID=1869339 RepID=UPI00286C243B|nr:DOPA 4,5-dioxygenase family protein [Polaromonas sp.]
MTQRPENIYPRYHAHVYFGADTLEQARALCQQAGELFRVAVGRVHEREVGPHPHWSCQIAFDSAEFERLIPWLEQHRNGLNVLVHGDTGDDLADHTTHAAWLGEPSALKLAMFRR